MKKRLFFLAIGVMILLFFSPVMGEELSLLKLTQALFPVPSPVGYEEPLAGFITEFLPSKTKILRDNLGSLYWRSGNKSSELAFCTPMDEPGYFVSGIDPEGYLRLDKAVYGSSLIDSYHLGHPMFVWTEGGPVEGVLALPSLHILSPEVRRELQEDPGLHLAYLDIGAYSEEEAHKKGVRMLDAVTPWREITGLDGGKMAGHSLGMKCCVAVALSLAQGVPKSNSPGPLFVWMAQTRFPVRRSRPRSALGALRAAEEIEAQVVIVVDVYPCQEGEKTKIVVGSGPVLVDGQGGMTKAGEKIEKISRSKGLPLQLAPDHSSSVLNPFLKKDREVIGLLLPVRFAQTPSEIVDVNDMEALHAVLTALLQEGRI